jgi:hypothetical protein
VKYIASLILALMMSVTAPLAAPAQEPAEPEPLPTARMEAVVGDSLIAYSLAWEQQQLTYAPGRLRMWAVPGKGYGDEDPWIETLEPTPEVLFIAMGANNANPLFGADGWTLADIEKHIHMIYDARRAPGVIPCIVLVTIAPAPSAPLEFRYHAGRANLYLRDKAASSPVYRMADWAARASGRDDWYSDGFVHLTPAGDQAYFDLLRSVGGTC